MKIALIILAVLLLLTIIVVILGWSLPVKHRASRQASYAASPDVLYAAIATPDNFPSWRSKVKSVELLPANNELSTYRETGTDGTILYVVEEAVPSRRLVTRIADKSLPFGGTWTYELTPGWQSDNAPHHRRRRGLQRHLPGDVEIRLRPSRHARRLPP